MTATRAEIEALIDAAAARHGLPPSLVRAVVRQESDFNPQAQSAAGAAGLMQLMPATARDMGIEPIDCFDPAKCLEAGCKYLAWLLLRMRGNARLALAAYNAGLGNVQRYAGVPPFPETQAYVRKVLDYYRDYSGGEEEEIA